MTVWSAVVQAFPILLYVLIGLVVGNALMFQIDDDLSTWPKRLLRIGAFLFGLVFWPIILLIGAAMLLRAMTYSGPF